jgi:adenylate cyclase
MAATNVNGISSPILATILVPKQALIVACLRAAVYNGEPGRQPERRGRSSRGESPVIGGHHASESRSRTFSAIMSQLGSSEVTVRALFWSRLSAVGGLLSRRSPRVELAIRRPKLSAIMAGFFVCLSIPILIFILVYNYHRNSEAILATLREEVAKTSRASMENVEAMIGGVAATLRLLAEVAAADPVFFRPARSNDVLYRALTTADEIDAAFVSFEDGYHRAVTRIDDDRRRSDIRIPRTANWHSNFIDEFALGENRSRHRTFFDAWGHVVGEYVVPTSTDYRTTSGYPAAKKTGNLAVTEPQVNVDTGYPIINLRFPVLHDGTFIGTVGASITLDVLSHFLATHRASSNSTTIIANPADGKVIAASDRKKSIRVVDGRLEIARLDNIDDEDVREAHQLQQQTSEDKFVFRSRRDGEELTASFARFPISLGQRWEAIVLTPSNDFIGELKRTNRHIVMIIVALSAAELLLIYLLSRRLSRPIESLSRELKSVETLSFDQSFSRPSRVREIAQLQSAAALLRNSLQSFCSFAPVDVVRGLIKSGIPLHLGVEARAMTIFFSDLENFSTQAEQSTPDALLDQMSVYFEQVTRAIADEAGTVDKFIGDGIMAFWGAPVALPDHTRRGCMAALRAARRMQRVNDNWRVDGKPTLRIRIGLNSAEVLVGNIGSSDRFSYTAIGDGVNVAARLEGMNKMFGTSICISDSVFNALASEIVARPLRHVQVKGRKQDFMIYELVGMADSSDPELEANVNDRRLSEMTWAASNCFEAGDVEGAARRYAEILKEFPGDRVAQAMLAECAPGSAPQRPEGDRAAS